jgi:hypothetical protein
VLQSISKYRHVRFGSLATERFIAATKMLQCRECPLSAKSGHDAVYMRYLFLQELARRPSANILACKSALISNLKKD